MEAQHGGGRIEIGLVVIHEEARGDANCSWTRHRNFAALREAEYTDRRPTFVFHVRGHKRIKYFEMTEIMPRLLGNDFRPIRYCGRRLRCAHQAEVRRFKISADEEL